MFVLTKRIENLAREVLTRTQSDVVFKWLQSEAFVASPSMHPHVARQVILRLKRRLSEAKQLWNTISRDRNKTPKNFFDLKLSSDLLRRLEAVTSVLEKVPSKSGGEKD